MLLDHEHLTVQDEDTVVAALDTLRSYPAVGFSDCLLLALARRAGHLPLGTFDRTLAKVEGAVRI
jgi:predicted nucleic acid-binding protein